MFNEIEKLDAFLGMIEADEEKETRPIFVKTIRNFDQSSGVMSAGIMIQTEYDNGMIIWHNYTDGIDPVVDVPFEVFPFIKHYFDDNMVKDLQAKVKRAKERLETQLKAEESKLVRLLNERGFRMIINGVWTQ